MLNCFASADDSIETHFTQNAATLEVTEGLFPLSAALKDVDTRSVTIDFEFSVIFLHLAQQLHSIMPKARLPATSNGGVKAYSIKSDSCLLYLRQHCKQLFPAQTFLTSKKPSIDAWKVKFCGLVPNLVKHP